MKRLLITTLLLLCCVSTAHAAEWTIDPAKSSIGFSGTHAGNEFKGVFGKWSGTVIFDPAALDTAHAKIIVDLASATTGNITYDKTLPQTDWFNISVTPEGIFETKSFKKMAEENRYEIEGTLTIRGLTVPVKLDAVIAITDVNAEMTAKTTLNRLDFSIGKTSDTPGDWVSLQIPLEIKVTATKK